MLQASAQSLPCSTYTLKPSPTPFRALSASANAVPPLALSTGISPPPAFAHCSLPVESHLPAVAEDLVLAPWGPVPDRAQHAQDLPCQAPAPVLLERGSDEESISTRKQKKGRRPGVLAVLKGVCRSLMGLRKEEVGPSEEAAALPVSRLEDDTPLLAWRQEQYVQCRLQDSPQLTVGEARVRPYLPPYILFSNNSLVSVICRL